MVEDTRTLICGAGPAGLACAAALGEIGQPAVVVDQADRIASSWRRHYDRLHLHTARRHSGLPGLPMPASYPQYPSRDQVVAYLEDYAAVHRIVPRLGTRVLRIRRGDKWQVETSAGSLTAQNVIVATGIAQAPLRPSWPGLAGFSGQLLHSSEYANPAPFAGDKVLVVGFGNSGGEIAMDLADAGVETALSVRGPVNVVPRDLLGMPILSWAILQRALPYRLVDAINAPILRLAVGDVRRLGLRRAAKGPIARIVEDGKAPIIDIGTIARLRSGALALRPDVSSIAGDEVTFADGATSRVDAIILATGYRIDIRPLLPDHDRVLDGSGAPRVSGRESAFPGLYFCGQIVVPTGQLREIAREARHIARLIGSSAARRAAAA